MRKLLIAIAGVCVLGSLAWAAGPPVIDKMNRHFDHDRHAASSAGRKQAKCADCHKLDAKGLPLKVVEHTRCGACHTFPTSCGAVKVTGVKSPARVCQVCHIPTNKACLPADLPEKPKTDDLESKFTHAKHMNLGSSTEKSCMQCHEAQAPGPGAMGADDDEPKKGKKGKKPKTTTAAGGSKAEAHALCAGCHNANGAKPIMDECAGCHVAPTARSGPQKDNPFRLPNFDHRGHHMASKMTSATTGLCTSCHTDLRVVQGGNQGSALPRPSMLGCQNKCHNGQTAFAATGTKCTNCHKGTEKAEKLKTELAFSHAQHAARNVKIADCTTCHKLESDGTLTTPLAGQDHQPCSNAGCHQTEFASRTNKICGVCHNEEAPWLHATARYPSYADGARPIEYFESMDHEAHLTSKAKLGTDNTACMRCHGEKIAASGSKPPEAHAACAPCHGRGQGPAMTQCQTCHLQQPPQKAQVSQWSVRALFPHNKHGTDPRNRATTKCTTCHNTVAKAKELATIKAPKMSQCDECHNGKLAFKSTGFECSRCHSPQANKPQATALFDGLQLDKRVATR